MNPEEVSSKMQNVVEMTNSDIASIRTGKATPGMVSDISVLAYGGASRMKVMELASVSANDPTTIVIDPWDKSVIGDIKKGIEIANVGFTPIIDGEKIRINIPPLTTEDREKFVKLLSAKIENARVAIRQLRSDFMKDIKEAFENKDITEDEKFADEKKLQDITDTYIEKIEEIGEKKKSELLSL